MHWSPNCRKSCYIGHILYLCHRCSFCSCFLKELSEGYCSEAQTMDVRFYTFILYVPPSANKVFIHIKYTSVNVCSPKFQPSATLNVSQTAKTDADWCVRGCVQPYHRARASTLVNLKKKKNPDCIQRYSFMPTANVFKILSFYNPCIWQLYSMAVVRERLRL